MRQEGSGSQRGVALGERKIVTVLFADIVDSTSIITSLDPEDANTTLLNTLHAACECIRRYRGTVSQIVGDGVLAVFGAPLAQEDHAIRGGLAAQEIHAGANRRGQNAQMRVGLSSGEVVAYGSQGGVYPFIRVVGEPVHLAARMQERARPGQTVISHATKGYMGERGKTRLAGQYQLTAGDAFEIYELIRVDAESDVRIRRTVVGHSVAPLIGRERELASLRARLVSTNADCGHSVLVTGEPGIGKSRLVHELVAQDVDHSLQTYHCDFQPAEIAQPLGAFRQMVGRLIHREPKPIGSQRDPLDSKAISAFLGENDDVLTDWQNLEPAQKLDVTVRAVTTAIINASTRQGFIIVCEDIHWADTIALRMIERLSSHIAAARILLVCTARSTSPIKPHGFTQAIDLQPLGETATLALVSSYLGEDPSLDELKDTLVRETQGNPYHLEECIAALVEGGTLAEVSGGAGFCLQLPAGDFVIPGSLRGALAARIDQLEPADRDLLLHAATIGRTFDTALLETITGLSTDGAAAHLNRLQERGFIKQSRLLPSVAYTFSHNLVQEVAYDTLLRQHRKQLHRAILAALSKRSEKQLPAKVELMADHAYRAEEWALAYLYSRRAAARAQAGSRNTEAKGYIFRALHAAEALGPTPQNIRRLASAQLQLVPSLFALGQHRDARDHLNESLKTARLIGNTALEARISSNVALMHWITGDHARAIRADRTALRISRMNRERDQQIASTIRMGMLFCETGHYATAERLLRRGLHLIPYNRVQEKFGLLGTAAVGARAYLARTNAEIGRFQAAVNLGDESIELSETCADPFSRAFANIFTGLVLVRQGDYRRANPILRAGVSLCERARLRLLQPLGEAAQGYVAWQLEQNRTNARGMLEKAVSTARTQNLAARRSLILSWLAEVNAREGRLSDAEIHAVKALRLARKNCERGQEAWALWILGEIHARCAKEDPQEAIAHYANAKRLAKRCGMRPLVAHSCLGLSRAFCHIHNDARAALYATQAKKYYKEMGLKRLARQAEGILSRTKSSNPVAATTYSAATS